VEIRYGLTGFACALLSLLVLRALGVEDPALLLVTMSFGWYFAGVAALRRERTPRD